MRGARLCAAIALVAAVACGNSAPRDTPGAVADRFLDLYLIEIDQQRALELTVGAARARLEAELAQTSAVRATGYGAGAAKPRVFYERAMLREQRDVGRARAVYDIRIVPAGGAETRRHALLVLANRGGRGWKVASFTLRDGPSKPTSR